MQRRLARRAELARRRRATARASPPGVREPEARALSGKPPTRRARTGRSPLADGIIIRSNPRSGQREGQENSSARLIAGAYSVCTCWRTLSRRRSWSDAYTAGLRPDPLSAAALSSTARARGRRGAPAAAATPRHHRRAGNDATLSSARGGRCASLARALDLVLSAGLLLERVLVRDRRHPSA